MKHIVRKENIHVVVEPRHNGDFGFFRMSPRGTPEEQERYMLAECDRVRQEIARHVTMFRAPRPCGIPVTNAAIAATTRPTSRIARTRVATSDVASKRLTTGSQSTPSWTPRRGSQAMTDPYTPTTEEVRDAYEIGAAGMATYSGNGIEDDESNEFDRWLAHHDAELRQQVAREIRAMGSESWDGYTPDEVPGTVAARIAEGPTMDRVESR